MELYRKDSPKKLEHNRFAACIAKCVNFTCPTLLVLLTKSVGHVSLRPLEHNRFAASIAASRVTLLFLAFITLFASCNDDDTRVFEKDADTRVAEAIDSLRQKLVAPANGWLLKYKPESESGAYYVLLNFDENGQVKVKSDLGADDGRYFDQTITYRIDNSLGLELIFENYSFFSYLFEQDDATFLAEFEFNYINTTSDGALVFNSKTDPSPPTRIVLQPAATSDENLLGTGIAENISKMNTGLATQTTVLKLSYTQKDVALYLKLDDLRRTIQINYISPKSSPTNGQKLDFSTTYILEGNAIVLDEALTGSFNGTTIRIESIGLDLLSSSETNICNDVLTVYSYSGQVSTGDPVALETSVFDPEGAIFYQQFRFFNATLTDRFISVSRKDDIYVDDELVEDIPGVTDFQMYFVQIESMPNSMGFRIVNPDASVTFALRGFNFTMEGNNIKFDFEPEYTLLSNPDATVDAAAMNKYLDLLTENNSTYVYRISDIFYEFYNPCNGYSFFLRVDP